MRRGFEGLMVGRTLSSRYEVLEAIARGGMSVVFRGLDRTLGREVGVKVVSLAGASDTLLPNFRERFRREAANAARIQHPNVVQIFDYGTDPELELDFIVMELLRGVDLKEALRAGPIDQSIALRILVDAARGVAAGHRAGIVHRDVKPANVFLLGEGGAIDTVKILDFGIAKPLEDDPEQQGLTTIGSLPHSPAYASPEQLDPGQPVTASSDVYQLGLIGYEMLAGQRPFNEEERARVRSGQTLPLPVTDSWRAVPPHICAVIQRALTVRAENRFPDAAAFAEALTTAREEDATAYHPVVVPEPELDETQLADSAPAAPATVPVEPELVAEPRIVPFDPEPEPVSSGPVPRPVPEASPPRPDGIPVTPPPSTRRSGMPRSPLLWAVPLLLLLAIFWATRGGGDDEPQVASAPSGDSAAADSTTAEALDREFVRLQGVAAQTQPAAPMPQPVPPGSATPGAATPGTTPVPGATPQPGPNAPPARPVDVQAQAQAQIQASVHALNQAWVDGNLSEHISHYGSRVDYYNSNNLARSRVRLDRARDLRRYDERSITLHAMEVQWLEPGRARVLVDKQWVFGDDEGRTRQGRGMQEYIYKLDEDDGKWYVVSEQLLTTTEARTRAGT